MKKRIISLLMAVVCLVMALSMIVSAAETHEHEWT